MPETRRDAKPITFFHLPYCPHCLRARQLMAQVYKAHPEYRAIPLREVNELKEAELADSYDYYLVPAFFVGNKKIHEGKVTYDQIKAVFDAALRD